jgi:hypothetical protein
MLLSGQREQSVYAYEKDNFPVAVSKPTGSGG